MTDYPPVIVLVITYRRLRLALETIRSVKSKIIYPNLGFHIADDGSGKEYVDRLCQEIGGSYSITVSDVARAGVGRSMNVGIMACLSRADLWLHLEDDWALVQPLDLAPCVQLLQADASVGMVRLGHFSAGLQGDSIAGAGKLWWRLKKGSNFFVFSGNAALRHRRFFDAYGPYTETEPPGKTEVAYCWQFNSKPGPDIVWPAWLSYDQTFHHIGDHQSYKWLMEQEGVSAEEAAKRFADMDAKEFGIK